MVQAGTDTLGSIPGQAVQVVPDGVIAIFIGNDPDGGGNLLFAGQPVCFFQIQEQIVHIRVCDGGAGTVVADGLDDVGSLGQQIFAIAPESSGSF